MHARCFASLYSAEFVVVLYLHVFAVRFCPMPSIARPFAELICTGETSPNHGDAATPRLARLEMSHLPSHLLLPVFLWTVIP